MHAPTLHVSVKAMQSSALWQGPAAPLDELTVLTSPPAPPSPPLPPSPPSPLVSFCRPVAHAARETMLPRRARRKRGEEAIRIASIYRISTGREAKRRASKSHVKAPSEEVTRGERASAWFLFRSAPARMAAMPRASDRSLKAIQRAAPVLDEIAKRT